MSSRHVRRLRAAVGDTELPSDGEGDYDPKCNTSTVEAAFKDLLLASDLEEEASDTTESFPIPRRNRNRKKNRKSRHHHRGAFQDQAAALPSDDDDVETDIMADEIDEEIIEDLPEDTTGTYTSDGVPSPDLPDTVEAQLPTQSAIIPLVPSTPTLTPTSSSSSSTDRSSDVSSPVSSLTLDTSDQFSLPSLTTSMAFDESEPPEADEIFSVSMRKMRVTSDIRHFFGGQDPEGNTRRKWSGRERVRRNAMLVDVPYESLGPTNKGVSMSIQLKQNGYTYFAFEHTPEHQRLHREFLEEIATGGARVVLNLEIAKLNTHVESLLEIFDTMCRREETVSANKLIEHVVAILQYAAHPGFHLCDRRVRLPYRYIENRPYHIALLKYIYMLTNKACHGTAFELAKVLYNLDPTDPIGMIIILDTLGIKARQYEWVLKLMKYWTEKRNGYFHFNLLYSSALASFHINRKKNNENLMIHANIMLQSAILRYPSVVTALFNNMEYAPGRELVKHDFYGRFSSETTGIGLKQLIAVYAKLNWPRWQEQPVLNWFLKNAQTMARRFDNDIGLKVASQNMANRRMKMYRRIPAPIIRHMCVLRPMSELIIDGLEVPHVSGYAAFDPLPPQDEVDRYGYTLRSKEEKPGSSWFDWLKEGETLGIDFDNMLLTDQGYDYIRSERHPPRPRSGTRWKAKRIHMSGARGGDDGLWLNAFGRGYGPELPTNAPRQRRHYRHSYVRY